MKSVRLVYLLLLVCSVFVLARSGRNVPTAVSRRINPHGPQVGVSFNHLKGTLSPSTTANRRGALFAPGLSFANAVTYGSGGYGAGWVAVADVDGDGKPDLFVTDCGTGGDCGDQGVVGVLLGKGDGTFNPAVAYGSGGFQPGSVAVADVSGDGKPDLLVANPCSNRDDCVDGGIVAVLLGNGDGTFQTAVTYGSGGYWAVAVAVADVNRDGKPDLLVANYCADYQCGNGETGSVGVLLGNGDGTFQTAVAYGSPGIFSESIAAADLNGDGKPDLVVSSAYKNRSGGPGGISVLLGNGDGTFQKAVEYGSGGNGAGVIAVADVNGDGKPDLLVPNDGSNNVCVMLGNGDGTFQKPACYDSGGVAPVTAAVADVNRDGKPDLMVANECATSDCTAGGSVGVLLGNEDGTFQKAVAFASGGNTSYSVAAADVNGDGKPDLIVTNSNSSTVGVLINTTISDTTTTLASSPNPSKFKQTVTFTATVTSQDFKGTPTGTVSFFDGSTNIGTSNLDSSGVATFKTAKLKVGRHSMTATYNGDSNFAPSTSPVLHQVVKGAVVSLSPDKLSFGEQTVGIASQPQAVTLTNTGNTDLTISSIQVTGGDSGDFAQKNDCPPSLSPSHSCKITVTFTPTTDGSRKADVTITDNAPDSPQSVPLSGVGVSPAVKFNPTKLTFSTQLVYTSSPPQKVTLTNTGKGLLLLTSIATKSPFLQTNDCGKELKPGAHCTITVRFHPKAKDEQQGAVTVTDNAPDSPQQVPLSGTGTYVQLRPTRLNFGVQPVGTQSLPKRVALTNQGHETLNIMSISITGKDAGDFSETTTCGAQLASGHSCFIRVRFKPLKKGKRTADVSISDDGGGSPQKVALSGTGT